jgi:hypothetical protein
MCFQNLEREPVHNFHSKNTVKRRRLGKILDNPTGFIYSKM